MFELAIDRSISNGFPLAALCLVELPLFRSRSIMLGSSSNFSTVFPLLSV